MSFRSTKRQRVAIIGAGISGLSTAYHLHQKHEVTVYEKNDYLGGHTDTHSFEIEGKTVRIDSGFIIFCTQYYPQFSAMLDELKVESQATNMSFSAHNPQSGALYNATNLNTLFCDRANILRPKFWRMLFDIARFYYSAPKILQSSTGTPFSQTQSVQEYLKRHQYSKEFCDDHLYPMVSALWSATPERVKLFPIYHLVDFFQRHGLMKLIGRPQWKVVRNGSGSYVNALKKHIKCHWKMNQNITGIRRENVNSNGTVSIHTTSENGDEYQQEFDSVVITTHADTALSLLSDPSPQEKTILSAIPFENNHVVVHTDESIMPNNKRAWASWNTEVPEDHNQYCCTANYWMNLLQSLPIKTNVFTSLNNLKKINTDKILAERHYAHPVFTADSVAAQKRLPEINGVNNTYYAGAYWGWGFHEDGARSAFEACQLLNANHSKNSNLKANLSA